MSVAVTQVNSSESSLKAPRNLLDLTTEEKRAFLNSFDHIFSDIDGVVWNQETRIENSSDGFNALKAAGKKIHFLTNNSVRPIEAVKNRFKNVNMDIDENDIIHPVQSVIHYLKAIKFEGLIYVIATENFKNFLREAGFQLKDGPTVILPESYAALAHEVFDKTTVQAVIIDFDFNLSSTKLMKAHFYLRNPDCLLISGATDNLLPVNPHVSLLGPGHFGKIIAEASKRQMITLGKPGKELGELIINRFNIKDTKRTLMIGDMLEQDVAFGKMCNFQTLVVLSGGCKLKELQQQTDPQLVPDYYLNSMADFVAFMKDVNKSNVY